MCSVCHRVALLQFINLSLQSQSLCLQLIHPGTSNLEFSSEMLIDVKQVEFLSFQILTKSGIFNLQNFTPLLMPAGVKLLSKDAAGLLATDSTLRTQLHQHASYYIFCSVCLRQQLTLAQAF